MTANGIRLHYLDWGGLGPALILIHGGLDNAHVFDDLAPALTSHFRVIAYDLRGHGHSDAKGPFDTATRGFCQIFMTVNECESGNLPDRCPGFGARMGPGARQVRRSRSELVVGIEHDSY